MAQPTFTITQGDTGPDLVATLIGANGQVQNLSGATVTFHMRVKDSPVIRIDLGTVEIDDVAGGKVRYKWQAADTAIAGAYTGEFNAVLADGTKITFPNTKDKILINIEGR